LNACFNFDLYAVNKNYLFNCNPVLSVDNVIMSRKRN